MANTVDMVRVIRGGRIESVHRGMAAICDASGRLVEVWGEPSEVIFPRSSSKMFQALPMVEAGLESHPERLALACASHQGTAEHTTRAAAWLEELGLSETDLRCGAHRPYAQDASDALVKSGTAPNQFHNNCSGKHSGFLALSQHLKSGPDYVEIDHPVQHVVKQTFEEVTGMDSPGWGVDGCSAPNFATELQGFAAGLAQFAGAQSGDARGRAMIALREAMAAHPSLVAGEGRACTDLMRAMDGVAVKTGAEAVFAAIVPSQGLGIAVKIADGGTRAAEAVITALLVKIGVLDAQSSIAQRLTHGPIRNCREIETGHFEVTL